MSHKQRQVFALLLTLILCAGCATSGLRSPSTGKLSPAEGPVDLSSRGEHVFAGATTAETDEPSGSLDLSEALSLVLERNPMLRAFSWEIRAREAEIVQNGLRANPELSLELENFAGGGEFGGFGGSDMTISLSQVIQPGGKREKRRQLAGIDRDLAASDYESLRLDVLTGAFKAFVTALATQGQLSLAEDLVRVGEEMRESVARRVRAGAASSVEERRALVALAASRLERDRIARELAAAGTRLSSFWGSPTAGFTEVVDDIESVLPPPPIETLRSHIGRNPDVARTAVERQRRQAALALEQAHRIPDVTLGAGIRRLSETDDNAFVAEVSLPLPLSDQNQGARRAADLRLIKMEKEREAVEVRVSAELSATYEELTASFDETVILKDSILPEAEAAFRAAGEAYTMGLLNLTDVLDTQRTLFELRGEYVSALASYHSLLADVHRLIGAGPTDMPESSGGP